ncbi:peptidylprolyl isomerase [Caldisalinibacter kiritimatiensis]|uniref:Foldase protein PrsA n=1 Tax=Caldisalinibacter kiritimatiensis TaxID=1304284 RepID=R1CH19_9FIRM|nr:peptidylprolyl isomerase [Caldisalinibacter kiritimatiensis]EOD01595.1 Foldase protein PrsA precursor [Caldisalinibacter kiritimatiensis]
MSNNKVLATVNGVEITEKDLNSLLQSLGQQRMQFESPEGRKRLLQELINQELFYLDAIENGLDEEEQFKKELEQTTRNLLKQYAIRKLLNQVKVDEQEVIDYYEQNKERFKTPETVKASHILVKDENKVDEILNELNNGLSFEEAAEKYSSCPSKTNGGDLGYFSRGKMVPEFENAAFNMEKGEVKGPVKTQFGYHIIKLTDKKEADIRSFDEVKGQINQILIGKKQNDLYINKTNELKEQYEIKINE